MLEKLFIQKNYADQLGSRLSLFKVQSYSPYRSNFRCPICGDSQKNRRRKRAYIIENGGQLYFHCHNECGTLSFESLLRNYFSDVYATYKLDLLANLQLNNKRVRSYEKEEYIDVDAINQEYEINLPLVETVPRAYEYLKRRCIPEKFFSEIYFTMNFHKFINEIKPGKFESSMESTKEPRIVMPMKDFDGKVFGVIARSLLPNPFMRYLTVKFDESKPKVFGLDRLNLNKVGYVVEGPIDSFFIDNGIALAGTDGHPDDIFSSKDDYVMVLDNQPRSKSVLKKYEKYIDMGCKVFIWPSHIKSKDINDCIKDGMSIEGINSLIRLNTYTGLKLKMMFNAWKKFNG